MALLYFCPMIQRPVKQTIHFTVRLILCLLLVQTARSQSKVLKGFIQDAHSNERIPFASMEFKNDHSGKLSDSAGSFAFRFTEWPTHDTLIITYVGYQDYKLAFDSSLLKRATNGVINMTILMERGKYDAVIVSRKIDRGLLMWKRIVRHKPQNDRYRFNNFSYELYNKLEVDIKNIKKDKFRKLPFVKKFDFILDNVDTTEEGATFLPIYLTEAISDYYYQKSPKRRREVFKGTKTMGISNESVSKFLGGMDQNVNFYSNFIPVFDKNFVSPISDNGDNFYNYKVLDTQIVNNKRLIHFFFIPKHKGQATFEGDCWVHDTTFAIQKMNLRLSKDANINYVDNLSLIQEFTMVDDSTWFLSRDKFVVDLSLLSGEKHLAAIGRKTTTYRNIVIDDSSVTHELDKNRLIEETILTPEVNNLPDTFWVNSRHEDLTKTEKSIYHTIDTLLNLPAFKRTVRTVNFLATGYLDVGNFQIGPWQNWVYSNVLEGLRLRWDLGTNRHFSKKLILHGYLAYGFTDQQFKYEADGMYLFKKNPRSYILAKYQKDIDYGQSYLDELSDDNIFALAIRKSGVPIKFMKTETMQVNLFKEWHNGFSVTLGGLRKVYDPLRNLPAKEIFTSGGGGKGDPLNSFEASVQLRFAYLEKFVENTFYRYSLGSVYPIVTFKYSRGLAGVFKSNYDYNKISGSISDYMKISPYGTVYYNLFAGRTYGTLPFMMLDVAPGNEIYYYNKYAYSLMNRWQYLHDRYIGFNFEHNIGNGIFRFTPFTRKWKWRQFYTVKGLWGSLSDANKAYNMPAGSDYTFQSLDGKTYLEAGTGIDNILKVLRVDFIWRVLPRPLPSQKVQRFGVFGSFRLAF
jgi:Family of unknown function (DUF5686)